MHSLLASVARLVNDHTSDEGRPRLAELIPSVIGLTGDDLHIDALITLRCATLALPVAAADRQRVLAVSILVCERVLAQLDGRRADSLTPTSEHALGAVPQARQWADRFTTNLPPRPAAFRRQAARTPSAAPSTLPHALIPDPDDMLRSMLAESIHICAAWTGQAASGVGVDDTAWAKRASSPQPRTVADSYTRSVPTTTPADTNLDRRWWGDAEGPRPADPRPLAYATQAQSRDCFREPCDRVRHGRPEHDLVVVVDPADHHPFDKGWRLVSHPSTQLSRNDRVPVPVDDHHRHLAVGQMLGDPEPVLQQHSYG